MPPKSRVGHGQASSSPATSLPPPESVNADNLQLPPVSSADIKKVLAVISRPSHLLFRRCAFSLLFRSPAATVASALKGPASVAAAVAGINHLPHLGARQAAIAAGFLSYLLACALGYHPSAVSDSARIDLLCTLLTYGVTSEEAGRVVAPAEVSGQDLGSEIVGLVVRSEQKQQGLQDAQQQDWMGCPRLWTLANCEALETGMPTSVVWRRVVQEVPLRQEVVDWALRAVEAGPLRAVAVWMDHVLRCPVPEADMAGLRKRVQQSQVLEPVLMGLPEAWQAAMRNCHSSENQVGFVGTWGIVCLRAYLRLFQGALNNTADPHSVPAPLFIPSMVSVMLDVLEGPAFLLPTATDATASSAFVHRLGELPRQQQQQHVTPDMAAKAAALQKLLFEEQEGVQAETARYAFKFLGMRLGDPRVVEELVNRGMGLRLVRAVLMGRVSKRDSPASRAGASLAEGVVAEVVRQVPVSKFERLWDVHNDQVINGLHSDPDLLSMLVKYTLAGGSWGLDRKKPLTPLMSIGLIGGTPTPAMCHVMESVLLRALQQPASHTLLPQNALFWEALRNMGGATELLWGGGEGTVQEALQAVVQELHACCCRQVLDPCFEMVDLLGVLASAECKIPRQQVVACQKEALWSIGQAIEEAGRYWDRPSACKFHPAVTQQEVWAHVAAASENQLSGQQLQQMFSAMKRQGYTSKGMGLPSSFDPSLYTELRTYASYCSNYCCTVAHRLLTHGSATDSSTSAWDSKPHLHSFATAAAPLAASLAAYKPVRDPGDWLPHKPALDAAAPLLVACLVTLSETSGSGWPLASEVWGGTEWYCPVEQHTCLMAHGDPVMQVAGMAWLAALLRGVTLRQAWPAVRDLKLWRCLAELAGEGSGGKQERGHVVPVMAGALLAGVAGVVQRAGLLAAVAGSCREAAEPQDASDTRERKGSGQEGGGKQAAGTAGERLLAIGRACRGLEVEAQQVQGVDWEAVLPAAWEGLDDVLLRQWWGVSRDGSTGGRGQSQVDPAGPAQAGSSSAQGQGGPADMRQCAMCRAQPEQLLMCSGCQSVRYCGAQCQRAHWKQHKRVCKELQAARQQSGG